MRMTTFLQHEPQLWDQQKTDESMYLLPLFFHLPLLMWTEGRTDERQYEILLIFPSPEFWN
jgi:hypothetical protein